MWQFIKDFLLKKFRYTYKLNEKFSAKWVSFEVSRSDSYANYNFYIKIEQRNERLFVMGELRDEEGNMYYDMEGIPLSLKEAENIYNLKPDLLPNCRRISQSFIDDVIVLDQPIINIKVTNMKGEIIEKADNNDFSIELYQSVIRCFRKKCKKCRLL